MIPFPDISPEIFSFSIGSFEFALRWYALSYIAGILLGWRLGLATLRKTHLWPNNKPPMSPTQAEDFLTWMVIGIILGGRFGYVVFYNPSYYFENPIEAFMIWHGGMSFHGGFLGVCLAAILYFRKHNIPLLQAGDILALTAPIGLFLGRIANFINAELWGRPTDGPWGVIFPGDAAQDCGQITGPCARHPSQLYEAGLEGLILWIILLFLVFKRNALKHPGTATGVFFIGYGMARFLVEFVRQPDAQFQSPTNPVGYFIQFDNFGLTMGQTLTLPMIAIGFILIFWSKKVSHDTTL